MCTGTAGEAPVGSTVTWRAPSACQTVTVNSWVQCSRSSPPDLSQGALISRDGIFGTYSVCSASSTSPAQHRPHQRRPQTCPWARAQREQHGASSKAPGAEVTEKSWTSAAPRAAVPADSHQVSQKPQARDGKEPHVSSKGWARRLAGPCSAGIWTRP